MSSSFFLKGKSRQSHKRKGEKVKKPKPNHPNVSNLENGGESSDSDLDLKKFSEASESDSDHETAEQKKLRLAKTYLEEIEKEEAKRHELKQIDDDAIGKRLQRDYLENKGKLRVEIADNYVAPTDPNIRLIRVREHQLSITCVCLSSNSQFAFTGSKCSSIVKWGINEKKKLATMTHKSHKDYLKGSITAIVLSSDSKFLATSDQSAFIQIWDPHTMKHLHTFLGHKDTVTGLVFRKNTHTMYSSSKDRSIKVWSLDEMAYVETLFGHQSPITSVDALTRERVISAGGRDATVRIWKIVEESHLIFNGPEGSLDEVKLLDEEHFVSGSDNGSLCVWSLLKKKPLCVVTHAHGVENEIPRWITSLATILNSDIFASGSYDNNIRLWKVCEAYRKVVPMFSVVANGFVNGIQFTADGRNLFAVLGQEHKNGRWWRLPACKNGVLVVSFQINVKS